MLIVVVDCFAMAVVAAERQVGVEVYRVKNLLYGAWKKDRKQRQATVALLSANDRMSHSSGGRASALLVNGETAFCG